MDALFIYKNMVKGVEKDVQFANETIISLLNSV